jgi:hypothetical protein
MTYKIMQIERLGGGFNEQVVREFETLSQAELFLCRLARKHEWDEISTTLRLRFKDRCLNREYYITGRDLS